MIMWNIDFQLLEAEIAENVELNEDGVQVQDR